MIARLMAIFLICTAIGCSGPDIHVYNQTQPKFDPFVFFAGDLKASGVVRNRSKKVIRAFNADIQAHIEGDTLILDENFVFSDGEKQYRRWEIKRTANATFQGTANDIEGTADGATAGFAMNWTYKMKLKKGESEYLINFDDWIYQTNNSTLINITDLTKWGFNVGEVVLVIHKV